MKHLLIFFIRAYQIWLSPWLGGNCRFMPSCSEYALEAIQRHGAIHGLRLSIQRLLRCQPFHSGGVDPVPLSIQNPTASTSASPHWRPIPS